MNINDYKWKIRKTPLNLYLGYLFEYYSILSYPFRPSTTPHTKFVIFGRGRSGSTLLVKLLDSAPNVHCDDEILNRKVTAPLNYILRRSKLGNHSIYGFKLLTYQLRQHTKEKTDQACKIFLKKLIDHDFKIIYLMRNNIMRQSLSNLYARHRMVWHEAANNQQEKTKITVNIKELNKWMTGSTKALNLENEWLEGLPYLKLEYENDLSTEDQQKKTIHKISEYLGIENLQYNTVLKRITPKEITAFVSNYDELEAFATKNNYQHYL